MHEVAWRAESLTGESQAQEGTKPDRQARREPGSHATHDAGHEPGEARRCAQPDVSAGTEIRKGFEPHWRKPPATNFVDSAGPDLVLLRGRTAPSGRSVWPRGSTLTRLCDRLPGHH